jgi:hypothetical protein
MRNLMGEDDIQFLQIVTAIASIAAMLTVVFF